jgi:peptide deformylase
MEILKFPSTTLKAKSKPINVDTTIPDSILQLVEDMKKTLRDSGGIGLAAPQVGHNVRLILVESKGGNRVIVMVNPEITSRTEEKYTQVEGCLSFPNVQARINRNKWIAVKWYDIETKAWKSDTFTDLTSACVQHEIDHLDGILLPDRIGPLKSKFTTEYFRKNR